ncbi:hypothetical protein C2U72_21930 [Prosthecomicrobium hirschii]|nr:hypothetical protein C2U72_21930 [Prosthecomicrobium hirschii]
MESLPAPPSSVSLPPPPSSVSLPPAPARLLLPSLPVSRLASSSPVRLKLPVPIRTMFSTLAIEPTSTVV